MILSPTAARVPPPCPPTPGSSPCSPTASAGPTTARAPRSTSSRRSSGPSGQALADHPDRQLLDFGIGENDDMADPVVRDALKREVDKVENRGYADNGIAAYKDAAAEFMQRQFGVTLDPVTEVCHCIGSKPAYAMLPAVLHQPRRRHAHDRARLPRRRHAHPLLRRRGPQAAAAGRERLLPRPRRHPGRRSRSGRSCSSSTTRTARPGRSPRRDFYKRVIDFAHTQPGRRRAGRGPHPAQLRRASR